MNTQPLGQAGQIIELCSEYLSVRCIWLCVLFISRTRFRVNPHFIVALTSGNSLLKARAISYGEVTADGLKPKPTYFLNGHSTTCEDWPNDWAVFWVLICKVHLTECSFHVMYAFQSESTRYSCLSFKELLARSKREIWRWSEVN